MKYEKEKIMYNSHLPSNHVDTKTVMNDVNNLCKEFIETGSSSKMDELLCVLKCNNLHYIYDYIKRSYAVSSKLDSTPQKQSLACNQQSLACNQQSSNSLSTPQGVQMNIETHQINPNVAFSVFSNLSGLTNPFVQPKTNNSTIEIEEIPSEDISITPSSSLQQVQPQSQTNKVKRVKLLSNWCSPKELCNLWNKMSQGYYTWGNMQVTWEDNDIDYYVIVNCTPDFEEFEESKTIVCHMEPHIPENERIWGKWSKLNKSRFFKVLDHATHLNMGEWHLSKTWRELTNLHPQKTKVMSAIVSGKYSDPGHIKRIDFLKYLEEKNFPIDIYGESNPFHFKNYKGPLPSHCKDGGLLEYKYHFNAENYSIPNYITEKLYDSLVCETLCFYWGAPNVYEYFDFDAVVVLDLDSFEYDYLKIKKAIEIDMWSRNYQDILKAKDKVLNEYNFFPTIEKLLE